MKTEGKVSHGHQKKDQCWVPTVNVICIITTLAASGLSARSYKISDKEFKNVVQKFENIIRS